MCNTNCCYQIILRQIYCQNGTRRTEYLVINNITIGTTIDLKFGFSVIISSIDDCQITFTLRDTVFGIPDQTFQIEYDSTKFISLPAQNGSYSICIALSCPYCCTQNSI